MTLRELISEELEIEFGGDTYLIQAEQAIHDIFPQIERAAIRFANQQTQELQAKILHYRREFVPGYEVGWYDEFFGITNQRGQV